MIGRGLPLIPGRREAGCRRPEGDRIADMDLPFRHTLDGNGFLRCGIVFFCRILVLCGVFVIGGILVVCWIFIIGGVFVLYRIFIIPGTFAFCRCGGFRFLFAIGSSFRSRSLTGRFFRLRLICNDFLFRHGLCLLRCNSGCFRLLRSDAGCLCLLCCNSGCFCLLRSDASGFRLFCCNSGCLCLFRSDAGGFLLCRKLLGSCIIILYSGILRKRKPRQHHDKHGKHTEKGNSIFPAFFHCILILSGKR